MKTLEERFWSKVNKNGPVPILYPELGCCWLWTGARDLKSGYGTIRRGKYEDGMEKAHRAAFIIQVGPIPEGNVVRHKCDNTECVRGTHLEAGFQKDNLEDMVKRGRRGDTGGYQRAKTHCPNGHAYDEVNTYVALDGTRHCRECCRIRSKLFGRMKRKKHLT